MSFTAARRHITGIVAAAVLALALALAGCGSSASSSASTSTSTSPGTASSSVALAKTKFVLHAGLAFGAFHHFVYSPLKAGDFSHPLEHKLTLVKAGLAAAYVVHELKLALADAQADPTLAKLVAPITALQSKLEQVESSVKSGGAGGTIQSANSAISSISGMAQSAGQTITPQTPSSL